MAGGDDGVGGAGDVTACGGGADAVTVGGGVDVGMGDVACGGGAGGGACAAGAAVGAAGVDGLGDGEGERGGDGARLAVSTCVPGSSVAALAVAVDGGMLIVTTNQAMQTTATAAPLAPAISFRRRARASS